MQLSVSKRFIFRFHSETRDRVVNRKSLELTLMQYIPERYEQYDKYFTQGGETDEYIPKIKNSCVSDIKFSFVLAGR